jgi:hypothetical protein
LQKEVSRLTQPVILQTEESEKVNSEKVNSEELIVVNLSNNTPEENKSDNTTPERKSKPWRSRRVQEQKQKEKMSQQDEESKKSQQGNEESGLSEEGFFNKKSESENKMGGSEIDWEVIGEEMTKEEINDDKFFKEVYGNLSEKSKFMFEPKKVEPNKKNRSESRNNESNPRDHFSSGRFGKR